MKTLVISTQAEVGVELGVQWETMGCKGEQQQGGEAQYLRPEDKRRSVVAST